MGIGDAIKRKLAMLSLSLANVEKNAFGQNGASLETNVNQTQKLNHGTLADSLIKGELTQEVLDLRWRTYKISDAVNSYQSKVIGYDDEGFPIVESKKIDKKSSLTKIKTEPSDDFPLEIVLDNKTITISTNDILHNQYIVSNDTPEIMVDDNLSATGATLGIITGENFYATFKPEKPLYVSREIFPKFNLENYTESLHVRDMGNGKKSLEFFVSKYPDPENRNSFLFVNEIKKAMNSGSPSTMFEIKDVSFSTFRTLGADDCHYYEYEIESFTKIVEFNGFYVIKFTSKVTIDGENLLEKYRQEELDKKYEDKTKK